jgi:Tfp pilus assembly protein PilZ
MDVKRPAGPSGTGGPAGSGGPTVPQADILRPCHVGYLLGDKSFEGYTFDFSETGMLVLCQDPPPLHTKLNLSLEFPNSHAVLEVQGEVVWTNRHGPNDRISPRGMGVRFINPDPLIMRVIGQLSTQYAEHGHRYMCYYS